MLRDRMPDLIRLARSDPENYHEPEAHPEYPLDAELRLMFSRADKVSKYLTEMKRMMWDLSKLQDSLLTSSSYKEEEDCRKQIASTSSRFNALARKCKAILKRFEVPDSLMQSYSAVGPPPVPIQKSNREDFLHRPSERSKNVQVSWHRLDSGLLLPLSSDTYIPAEIRMRFHLNNVLSHKLNSLVREYFVMQRIHGDRCKEKIKRQMSIIGKELDDTDLEEALHRGEKIPLLHRDIEDDIIVDHQMRSRIKEVEVLHKELLYLEKSIGELQQSFAMISSLIYEQGAIVDRIDQHIAISADYVEDSTQLLKKASIFQHKYRKKKVILAVVLIVVVTILVIIIVVAVQKKHTKIVVQATAQEGNRGHGKL